MAVKESTKESRQLFDDQVVRAEGAVAEMRQTANRLVTEIGTVDARRRAKSLRIRATRWQREINLWVALVHVEANEVAS